MAKKSLVLSSSPAETRRLAGQLAEKISRQKNGKNAAVITLDGHLGAGKTVFAKGFAYGLKIRKTVTSPTFIIFKTYKLAKTGNFQNFIHVDAYRLKKISELKTLKFQELLDNPQNIILIEWADNIKKIIPKNALRLKIHSGQKEKERIFESFNNNF
ncbi:MAG: tRNA (adenosine(37)-N6)-threonylcarbamoyltransferase complex ATPase subunit type 1 TsaE [bacterium]|nr:tRNA (adenosine(37)-N6)-threonylcarbamoyltransferase complex ATPase subunit type 1 TsaE [bacterium]